MTLTNTRPRDEKDWRGLVEFELTHNLQRRHAQKSAPRPHDPQIGKLPPQRANAEIVEMEQQIEPASKSRAENDVEPEELDHQVRESRHVAELELENALRSLPQRGEKMTELLLWLFNLEDPETAAPRTADRWITLPRYWIRMHHARRDCYFHPDDANSPVDGMLSDHLWGDRCRMFFDSTAATMLDTGHQSEWAECRWIALLLVRMRSRTGRIGVH